jgi:hypothetical protein
MSRFASVVCLSFSALGILAVSGTAIAQNVPQAKCPYGESGDKDCPPTETPTTGDTTPVPAQPQPAPQQQPPQPPPAPSADVDVNIQPPQPAPVYTEPTYTTPTYTETSETTLERWGIGVSIGGGVSGFTDDSMRDTTDDGGEWDVRVTMGLRLPIALEASYIGSAQSIDALGLDSDAILVGNGLQGALRVNLLDFNVQPFVYGGLAWRRYSLANESFNTSDVANEDDVLEVPVGVGVAWKYKGFMLDARGEFRWASQEDMIPDARLGNTDMHRYGASANLGFAF